MRVWNGERKTGTEVVYVCDDGTISYGKCMEDGTWQYGSAVGNVGFSFICLLTPSFITSFKK